MTGGGRETAKAIRMKATSAAVAVVATLLMTVAGVECAKAGSQGNTSSIVFTSDRKSDTGGLLDIYRMDADGRGPTKKLTDTPGNDVMPAWSADGDELVYVRSDLTGMPNIYRMDVDGSNETPVTAGPSFNTDPAWFPNNRKIAFSRSEDIYAMVLGASGDSAGKLIRFTRDSNADRQPVVSADGRRIAFASDRDGDFDIYVMKAAPESATNRPVKLTRNATSDFTPEWSPDGKRIAFTSGRQGSREIYVMKAVPQDTDTNPPNNLTSNAADDSDPAWSPDGRKIAFTSDRTGDGEIWAVGADGADPSNLTRSPASEELQPDWQRLP